MQALDKSLLVHLAIGIGLLIAIGFYLFRLPLLMQIDEQAAAKLVCRVAIKDWLSDPSSAEFDSTDTFQVRQSRERFTVKIGLRAKNAFNATIYNVVRCEVLKLDGVLKVQDLAID